MILTFKKHTYGTIIINLEIGKVVEIPNTRNSKCIINAVWAKSINSKIALVCFSGFVQ